MRNNYNYKIGCFLYSFHLIIVLSPLWFFFGSCKKVIKVEPPITSTVGANAFNSDANAISVLTGIYANMSKNSSFSGNGSISFFSGLSSDELTLYSGVTNSVYIAYYKNALIANATPISGSDHWYPIYNLIYVCNSAIEGLSESSSNLTPVIRQQLMGEAKFMRAFFYFYLVNMFGDVPLALTTDYKVNASLSRSSSQEVYQQIIFDLKEAALLLNSNYLDGKGQAYLNPATLERIRPTKWAAQGLLARAYLYTGDFENAEIQSTGVIDNKSLYDTVSLNNVFLKNSKEAIWQLQPVTSGHNTEDGWYYILPSTGPSNVSNIVGNPVYMSDNLLNSFESNDLRKSNWVRSIKVNNITYSYPYKYKSASLNAQVSEYSMVLRLGELYLVRAEARAQLGKTSDALADLNTIRKRAGLSSVNESNKELLLATISHERQIELFSEWGHRWFDLKRTKNIDAVMSIATPKKGGIWKTSWQWYPLPLSDIEKNKNLIQNTDY